MTGRVRQLRHHDYRPTESEKLQGYALMCFATALTNFVFEAAIAHGASEIPAQSIVARPGRMENICTDVMLFELLAPRTNRLRFLAGQSARVTLGGVQSTLPIASCPCEERRLHFHLRRRPDEHFSDYAFRRLQIGESVPIEGPLGDFVLRDGATGPLIIIACGWAAFAPLKSVIEHALAQNAAESIDLYWSGANATDHYFPKFCRSWPEALDNFRYTALIANTGPETTIERLISALDDPVGRDFYVARDAAQVEATRAVLCEHGLLERRVITWVAQ